MNPTTIYTCPDYSYEGICTRGDYALWRKLTPDGQITFVIVHRSNDLPALMGDPIHILEKFTDKGDAIAALNRWQHIQQPWAIRPFTDEEINSFFQRHAKGFTMWQFLLSGKAIDLIREKKGDPRPKGSKAAKLRELFHEDIPDIPQIDTAEGEV